MMKNGYSNILSKIVLLIVLILVSLTSSNMTWSTSDLLKISVDGETVEFNDQTGFPFIDWSGRTQVPIKGVLTTYGAEVYWNTQNKEVVVKYDRDIIVIPINDNYIKKNGEIIQIDTQAIIKNGRSYIPIKCVIDALGGEAYKIVIYT